MGFEQRSTDHAKDHAQSKLMPKTMLFKTPQTEDFLAVPKEHGQLRWLDSQILRCLRRCPLSPSAVEPLPSPSLRPFSVIEEETELRSGGDSRWKRWTAVFSASTPQTIPATEGSRAHRRQDSSSKLLSILLKERVAIAGDSLPACPQYAYCSDKSIEEAIARVSGHCKRVRDSLKQAAQSVHCDVLAALRRLA